ncbi:small ribosomal subunit protein uS14-like [Macaca nemestrina]|uniref:small ribosomal subunit protein uS14-like n=1 Tax=Macaca nemestrina TaxID=9545 RepID=UPI0001D54A37|nr:40S ribosomal protein S29-like isoform X2 [Macaca nemestrina]XP_045237179.1 40S ribosomal protein S29-like [Macaca fascicularis]
MGHQQLYWNHPRKFSQGSHSCYICSNKHGLLLIYCLDICCLCFYKYLKDIGFIKLD